jgi:hypothetical protein
MAKIATYALSLEVMLPPPYQRPPGAEIPAMGFAVVLKILVKANLLSS